MQSLCDVPPEAADPAAEGTVPTEAPAAGSEFSPSLTDSESDSDSSGSESSDSSNSETEDSDPSETGTKDSAPFNIEIREQSPFTSVRLIFHRHRRFGFIQLRLGV